MFTGRPHRSVNLGSRRPSSTNDALRNAEMQRQKREKLRKETAAAAKLQQTWRAQRGLKQARHALAEQVAHDPSWLDKSEVYALIIPDFVNWPAETITQWTQIFLASPKSAIPSSLLLHRLPLLWDIPDFDTAQMGLQLLSRQAPSQIGLPLMIPLLKSVLAAGRPADFQWLASKYTATVLEALLNMPEITALPETAFRPFYNLTSVPAAKSILVVLEKVMPHANESWPLIFAITERAQHPEMSHKLAKSLTHEVVNTALERAPIDLAAFVLTVLHMAPDVRPLVLLQLATTRVNSLKIYWDLSAASELALSMVVELVSYWLLVSTDYELSRGDFGLELTDLCEFAGIIKERCFRILWEDRGHKKTPEELAAVHLLRQIYTRDSRMHFFPHEFWVVPTFGMKFAATFDSYLQGNRPLFAIEADEEEDLLELNENPAKRVLDYAPFFIPFEQRVMLFSKFVGQDREKLEHNLFGRQHFDINRESVVEDTQHVFASLGASVKTEMAVRLLSDGLPEAGIDGGGLTRELLIVLCDKLFHDEPLNAEMPLFVETEQHTLMPNPVFGESPELMTPQVRAKYLFMGQVIGKCLYENLLIDVEFAPMFLSKWRHQRSSFDDLVLLDDELYRNLTKLHAISGADVENLGLDFTTVNSQHEVVALKRPNAIVTDVNKVEYMRALSNYKLNTVFKPQTSWFLLGLSQIIRLEWLGLFNPSELNRLISGESMGMNVEDLKKHVVITGFPPDSPTLANLWMVLREFNSEERALFLKFVTSVPKPPLLGFARLEPRFGIRYAGHEDDRLPTASTCVNLLKLPEYSSKEVLKRKLLYSINSRAGFELS